MFASTITVPVLVSVLTTGTTASTRPSSCRPPGAVSCTLMSSVMSLSSDSSTSKRMRTRRSSTSRPTGVPALR
ncbi:MAG TPA: hypothetical protein VK112_12050 [Fodinibius sp.]|nr:hypothetical protein [Fodinibius sp.]